MPSLPSRSWAMLSCSLVFAALMASGCSSSKPASQSTTTSRSATTTNTIPAPAGLAFYTPPSPLAPGAPGAIIWARPLTGSHVLPDAAKNALVLFHSTAVRDNADVAESAMVAFPKGAPPPGGWPVIAFAHGDVGAADSCVVSGDNGPGYPSHDKMLKYDPVLNDYVKRGFVVVRPDYEGLGTPGPNPNGIGEAMARSMVDSVRAARRLDSRVGSRWAALGHSHGGRGVLFTADAAAKRAPELVLVGTVSMAPLSATASRLRAWAADPKAPLLDGNFAQQLFGAAAAYPDVRPAEFLTPSGLALYDQVEKVCQVELLKSWFGKPSGDVIRRGADLQALFAAFDKNEPGSLHLARHPILIVQGLTDVGILPATTQALVKSLQSHGATDITYRTYPRQDHLGVVGASQSDVEQWVAAHFATNRVPNP
jgi:hypothetical protein